MRSAHRQPLSDVFSTVLNKIVSRDVAASLIKYKMGAGAGGKRRSKSNGRDDCDDSTVRFQTRSEAVASPLRISATHVAMTCSLSLP
jgi:hypothetical protein